MINEVEVVHGIFIGAAVEDWRAMVGHGAVLLLSPRRAGDHWRPYGGWRHMPWSDSGGPMTPDEARVVREAATFVVGSLHRGQSVHVFCVDGRNKSALVAALALLRLKEAGDAEEALAMVRSARPGAVSSPHFEDFLRRSL